MENQINTGEQSPPQVSQNSVSQPVITPEKPKINYLTMGGVALVCSLIFGFGGYYLGKQSLPPQKGLNDGQNQVFPTPTSQIDNSTPTINPSSTSDPTANWKTYENKQLGFSLKMPSNWSASLETKTEPFESSVLSIASGEYKLVFATTTAGYGGIICDFIDSTDDQFAGPGIDNLGDPTNLEGAFGNKLRRNKNQITLLSQYGYQRSEFDYRFRICQVLSNLGSDGKNGYSGTFNTKSGTTEIVYYTPMTNIKSGELKLLDQILSSFKFTQ